MSFLRKLFLPLVLICCVMLGKAQQSNYPADLVQLHKNIWTEIIGDVKADTVQPYCDRMKSDGSWPDVDYTSKQRGNWPTARHLSRLWALAKAYQIPGSELYHSPRLLGKINLALNYWLDNDFQCPNWWYPEIGVPMNFAPTLILMEAELTPEQKAKGIKILDRAKIGMTGQNKVWLSGNVLMKSLLLRDSETIRKAAVAIQDEMKVSLDEGIQPDGSFHQHGPQIQFGNYGLAFVNEMIRWIRMLRNTPFCFDETRMSILRNYLLNGQQWITWKNQMDISACGRQLFVGAQRGKAGNLAGAFKQMETLDPAFAEAYKKAGRYENLNGNRHFWCSDFQIQRTPDYYFSVKMNSKRVIGAESCNSENLLGYYLGDGATYLYQSGKEYIDIFPYWDWKKIPGTTIRQDNLDLPVLTASGYRIASEFVGGVSDGESGIAALDYAREGVSARKSWFLFNGQIVCLGAGISSNSGFPVTTSVNQSFLNGDVIVKTSGEQVLPNEASQNIQAKWILHDQLGYFFPAGGDLILENKTVTGSWNRVASMYKNEPIKSKIFKLWFAHGTNPQAQAYAYALIPGATKEKMKQLEAKPSFKILKNGDDLQSVVSADQKWTGLVFYKAGTSEVLGGVESRQPCIVMLTKNASELILSVAEPTQKLGQIQLVLKGNYQAKSDVCQLSSQQGTTVLTIQLPQGQEAGKTVSVKLVKK